MNKFAEYVTGTAFDLKLSKNMVRALSRFDYAGTCVENFMTVSSLRCRGLIEHRGNQWVLTEAGKLVVQLMKMAGVYESQDKMNERLGINV